MLSWPHYDDAQIAVATEVLRSGKVNAWTGPHVSRFEEEYAALLGRRHAIALANGTLALDLALHAIGLEPGDEVIVTPRSFVASASCVAMAGGVPVFADVDRDSQNLTAESIDACITPRTRAVIVVHLAGWPCDMPAIMDLARRRGILVIEDCAQAHGAEIDGRPVGAFGDVAAFSFCQDKILTTGGEGGLIALDDDAMWRRAWSRKDHGKSHDAVFERAHPPGFRWLHESFGTNLRMTGLQAALGSHQLGRLEAWREARTRNAMTLAEAARTAPTLRVPLPPEGVRHAWYRFYVFARPEAMRAGWNRDRMLHEIAARGTPVFSGSCGEIYLEKCFLDAGFGPPQRLASARALAETSLAFLVDPAQEAADMARAADALREVALEAAA